MSSVKQHNVEHTRIHIDRIDCLPKSQSLLSKLSDCINSFIQSVSMYPTSVSVSLCWALRIQSERDEYSPCHDTSTPASSLFSNSLYNLFCFLDWMGEET